MEHIRTQDSSGHVTLDRRATSWSQKEDFDQLNLSHLDTQPTRDIGYDSPTSPASRRSRTRNDAQNTDLDGRLATSTDIEAQVEKSQSPQSSKSDLHEDPNLITWNGPSDPENPKNWTMKRKWMATLTLAMFSFISPITSSMVAPALPSMARDLNVTTSFEQSMILSIFVLAYAVGPMFLGPVSEVFGRIHVLQLANLVFLAFNLGCGFAQNKGQIIGFRFMAGLGGSAPLAVGGGILSDIWRPEQRGKALSIYTVGPLLGPALGPIAGGFIAENTTWRWVFWATTIYNACAQVVGLFLLRETYPPVLLTSKAKKLRKETGNEALYTEYDHPDRSLFKLLETAVQRPFRLLFTQPIIIVLSLLSAYLYGVMYLVLTTYSSLWTDTYHESVGIAGLNYIAMGLGFTLGAQICAPLMDKIYIRLKKRNNNVGKPEYRVPLMFPGALLVVPGIFIYGWTANFKTQWIGPNIGICLYCAGTIISFQGCQSYTLDAYPRFAASAMSAVTFLRSLAGFGFPLFATAMYNALGIGWGNSLLGFFAVGIGLPAPFLLWRYGEKLRSWSHFAAGGE